MSKKANAIQVYMRARPTKKTTTAISMSDYSLSYSNHSVDPGRE